MSKVLEFLFGKPGKNLTASEREVSDSIKKLKTLKVTDGRVSISPSEVLTEEYLKERKEARRLLSA
jgi:hypothetical protein